MTTTKPRASVPLSQKLLLFAWGGLYRFRRRGGKRADLARDLFCCDCVSSGMSSRFVGVNLTVRGFGVTLFHCVRDLCAFFDLITERGLNLVYYFPLCCVPFS